MPARLSPRRTLLHAAAVGNAVLQSRDTFFIFLCSVSVCSISDIGCEFSEFATARNSLYLSPDFKIHREKTASGPMLRQGFVLPANEFIPPFWTKIIPDRRKIFGFDECVESTTYTNNSLILLKWICQVFCHNSCQIFRQNSILSVMYLFDYWKKNSVVNS